jgi:hypothetical protein
MELQEISMKRGFKNIFGEFDGSSRISMKSRFKNIWRIRNSVWWVNTVGKFGLMNEVGVHGKQAIYQRCYLEIYLKGPE